MSIYMELEANGNVVKGGCSIKPYEDWITVLDFSMPMKAHLEGGLAARAGRRLLGPLKFTKPMDKATPVLFRAFSNNEVIKLRMNLHSPHPDTGENEHRLTLELDKGRIIEFNQTGAPTSAGSSAALNDVVVINAQVVTWTWEEGGISHMDDWHQAV